ncbi:hypothetical protein M1105_05490 [Limibaculum sp. FT325]|uniref:hypothetical protein n=1 Tax=Thermohalobaculum sediminis TaxID=2939436 RepID=UPI0020BE66C5|nr:hypothetical protein [Limibaculum sediminis]MCL5776439.1 hypothetical protein [Limibaculum sediminis]
MEKVMNAIRQALELLPASSEPGHATPGALAHGVGTILRAWLQPGQRSLLARASIESLDRDEAEELLAAMEEATHAGPPIAPFDTITAEAENWAALALLGERRAYFAAIWRRFPGAEKAAFLRAARDAA